MAKTIVKLLKLVIMAVTIIQLVDNELTVNDKQVYKDTNGNWVSRVELTTAEQEALQLHLKD